MQPVVQGNIIELKRHVEHQTDRFIPGIVHNVSISTEQILEWASCKMIIVYPVDFIPWPRVGVGQFLDNLIVLLYIKSLLGFDVHFLNSSHKRPMSDDSHRI